MFDIGWSELLVVGIVALVVVGPKDLPVLLRTIGRYMGMIRRQAGEFRAQFDEAMRESELDQLRKDVTQIKSEAENTLRDTERAVSTEVQNARSDFDVPAMASTAAPGFSSGPSAAAAAAAAAAVPGPSAPGLAADQKTGA